MILRRLAMASVLGLVLAGGASTAGAWGQRLDDFAKCVSDSGATFYGTYWCPQCDRQRDLFGMSDRYLNYVECAYRDSDEQKRECKRAGVKSYPTWEFGDGSRMTGFQTLRRLADRTDCALPEE
jgi:hypothetical protein